MYHTIQAYRCTDLEAFKGALDATAKKHGGSFREDRASKNSDEALRVSATPTTITIYYPQPIAYFTRDLSYALGAAPIMEARIQASSHWDYSLSRGAYQLDCFSTLPLYFEGGEDPILSLAERGNPEMISLVFGVPVERFERYLRHWEADWDEGDEEYRTKLEGKAYPGDRSGYGDYEQFWDFLPSIGIQDPCEENCGASEWELRLPEPVRPAANRPRKAWWRRMISR